MANGNPVHMLVAPIRKGPSGNEYLVQRIGNTGSRTDLLPFKTLMEEISKTQLNGFRVAVNPTARETGITIRAEKGSVDNTELQTIRKAASKQVCQSLLERMPEQTSH